MFQAKKQALKLIRKTIFLVSKFRLLIENSKIISDITLKYITNRARKVKHSKFITQEGNK